MPVLFPGPTRFYAGANYLLYQRGQVERGLKFRYNSEVNNSARYYSSPLLPVCLLTPNVNNSPEAGMPSGVSDLIDIALMAFHWLPMASAREEIL